MNYRILVARQEISEAVDYEYLVVNDDLETAFRDLRGIVLAERCRNRRDEFGFSERLKSLRE